MEEEEFTCLNWEYGRAGWRPEGWGAPPLSSAVADPELEPCRGHVVSLCISRLGICWTSPVRKSDIIHNKYLAIYPKYYPDGYPAKWTLNTIKMSLCLCRYSWIFILSICCPELWKRKIYEKNLYLSGYPVNLISCSSHLLGTGYFGIT